MPADDNNLIGIVFPFPRAITAIVGCIVVNVGVDESMQMDVKLLVGWMLDLAWSPLEFGLLNGST